MSIGKMRPLVKPTKSRAGASRQPDETQDDPSAAETKQFHAPPPPPTNMMASQHVTFDDYSSLMQRFNQMEATICNLVNSFTKFSLYSYHHGYAVQQDLAQLTQLVQLPRTGYFVPRLMVHTSITRLGMHPPDIHIQLVSLPLVMRLYNLQIHKTWITSRSISGFI